MWMIVSCTGQESDEIGSSVRYSGYKYSLAQKFFTEVGTWHFGEITIVRRLGAATAL